MVDGRWLNGQWLMVNGQWSMANSQLAINGQGQNEIDGQAMP